MLKEHVIFYLRRSRSRTEIITLKHEPIDAVQERVVMCVCVIFLPDAVVERKNKTDWKDTELYLIPSCEPYLKVRAILLCEHRSYGARYREPKGKLKTERPREGYTDCVGGTKPRPEFERGRRDGECPYGLWRHRGMHDRDRP